MTLMMLSYFGFHAINGPHGLRSLCLMDLRIAELELKIEKKIRRCKALEKRIALLRDGSMEKDMVDQYIRSQLNMLRQDEVAIIGLN